MPGIRTAPSHRAHSLGVREKRIAAVGLVVGSLLLTFGDAGSSGAASSHTEKSVVIATTKTATLGTILVSGTTLYTLKPSSVTCATACHKYWPEVLLPKGVTKATAGKGVSASALGTIARPHGARQVTYDGKPLYWFALDNAPGQVKGNITDEWGTWSDVVIAKPASSTTTTTVLSPTTTTSTKSTPTNQPTTTVSPPTTTTNPPTTVTTVPSGGGVGF